MNFDHHPIFFFVKVYLNEKHYNFQYNERQSEMKNGSLYREYKWICKPLLLEGNRFVIYENLLLKRYSRPRIYCISKKVILLFICFLA